MRVATWMAVVAGWLVTVAAPSPAVERKSSCSEGYHQCQYNGVCIAASWVCDGNEDCPVYGDDEEGCNFTPSDAIPPILTGSTGSESRGTTDRIWATTDNPWGTTDSPWGTTDSPWGTTDSPWGTTDIPWGTTDQPVVLCDGVYELIYNRCVFVEPFIESSWKESRYLCETFDEGDLVVIDSFDFYKELISFIKEKGLEQHDYWVGATDEELEGWWHWVDYTDVWMDAPLWALYQDYNGYSLEPKLDTNHTFNCGYLDMSRALYMDDDLCLARKAAICQKRGFMAPSGKVLGEGKEEKPREKETPNSEVLKEWKEKVRQEEAVSWEVLQDWEKVMAYVKEEKASKEKEEPHEGNKPQ